MGEIITFKKRPQTHLAGQQHPRALIQAGQSSNQKLEQTPMEYALLQAKIDKLQEVLDAKIH